MCGIAGIFRIDSAGPPACERIAAAMAGRIAHRGPDEGTSWSDSAGRVALGHRRLKVIDLSPAGGQPMASASGRFTIAYNGEIYNHLRLRAELEALGAAPAWRGHSDTETLLAAIDHWGIEGALTRAIGMFAFALWDAREARLTLARDRIGEKPLYYGRCGGAFAFASELKAFAAVPGFDSALDDDAVGLYLWFGYIPAPRSIYRGIAKLTPGMLLSVTADGRETERPYWSLDTALHAAPFAGSAQDAADETERLLRDAVALQSIADVPVGAFLSGGVDSSVVVALMAESGAHVKTFSLGFEDAVSDESPYARAVAAHLGTDHHELLVTPADAQALIPRLPEIWDEPFADSSQIPTAIVSRLARERVTVSLSGDGGDELFLGYPWYRSIPGRERIPAKAVLAAILRHAPPRLVAPLMGREMTADRLARAAHLLGLRDPQERYLSVIGGWSGAPGLARKSRITPLALAGFAMPGGRDLATLIAAIDVRTYLVDDLLVKVDRAAMAVSLETRMPLLDHRLVELAFTLPASITLRDGRSKWPLRRVLDKYVPRALIDRPKHGFSIPLGDWLRGPLRDWAGDLLSRDALAADGLVDAERVARLWDEHRSGARDHAALLWKVLMLQSWRDLHRA